MHKRIKASETTYSLAFYAFLYDKRVVYDYIAYAAERRDVAMKRTIIGGFIMFAGLLTMLTIVIVGAFHMTTLTSWSGSRLLYAIFSSANGDANGLSLGIPFVAGALFFVAGLAVLVTEFFEKPFLKG